MFSEVDGQAGSFLRGDWSAGFAVYPIGHVWDSSHSHLAWDLKIGGGWQRVLGGHCDVLFSFAASP